MTQLVELLPHSGAMVKLLPHSARNPCLILTSGAMWSLNDFPVTSFVSSRILKPCRFVS